MKAFRIVKAKYTGSIQEVFNGQGARKYGGRWNSIGLPCVYLAGSESLAILEMVAHLNTSSASQSYALFSVEIEDQYIMELASKYLPVDWQEYPAPPSTAQIGDQWMKSMQSAVLVMPSTIVTREKNCLLNVKHPDCTKIIATVVEMPFELDPRLT